LNQATPVIPGGYSPMQRADAVYLDELVPAAPPEVRVAGLIETTIPPATQIVTEPQATLPPGTRDGVFQKIYLNGTWLPAIEDEPDALGLSEVDFGVVFGFPMLRRDTPLLVTPQAGIHFLENAAALDLPSTLYDTAVEFRHLRKFGGGPWAMDVAATVGYYSDFEQSSSDALRVSGRGLAVYQSSPSAKWLLGVAYLNRAGASVLPVFGAILEPSPDLRVELLFPRPRVAWRTAASVTNDQRWVYVGGEFGGGVWSVTRPSTDDLDLVSYSDWRVLAGYERKVIGGLTRKIECGYVFNRELEFDEDSSETALDDTLFIRGGVTY